MTLRDMTQLSYRAYLALQLWCYLLVLLFGLLSAPGILAVALSYLALWWNFPTVDKWMLAEQPQPRDRRGRGRFARRTWKVVA